jgi:hypothetical protein
VSPIQVEGVLTSHPRPGVGIAPLASRLKPAPYSRLFSERAFLWLRPIRSRHLLFAASNLDTCISALGVCCTVQPTTVRGDIQSHATWRRPGVLSPYQPLGGIPNA